MKVCIVTGVFPPDIGGPATHLYYLSNNLLDNGHEIAIITYGGYKDKYRFPVYRISRRLPLPIRLFLTTIRTISVGKRCDVFYVHDLFTSGLPALIAKKILQKPLVTKFAGDFVWETSQNRRWTTDSFDSFQDRKQSFKIELLKGIRKKVLDGSDKIIVPSVYLRRILKKWGILENKIEVIYNAVNGKECNIMLSKREAKEAIGLNGTIILTIARLTTWKGVDKLIMTRSQINKKIENVKLVIVGKGPQLKNLKCLARSLGMTDNIIFTGRISHKETLLYLRAADIFVLNTGYEGLSHTILEAMAIGTPIVTTNVGGNPELIEDGKNGILITSNNTEELKYAIIRLLTDETLREKFIMNSKIKVKQNTWDSLVEQTLNVLGTIGRSK